MFTAHGLAVQTTALGGMMGIVFQSKAVETQQDIQQDSVDRYQFIYHRLLGQSILLPPSAYEALFIGLSHDDVTLTLTLKAIEQVAIDGEFANN